VHGSDGGLDKISLIDGMKLQELLNGTSMEVLPFLNIALTLTELVHTTHKRDTIIGDLNPTGVRIQTEMNLADLAECRTTDYAYLSPEQTGRINHGHDILRNACRILAVSSTEC
jgi:hypothetical protein